MADVTDVQIPVDFTAALTSILPGIAPEKVQEVWAVKVESPPGVPPPQVTMTPDQVIAHTGQSIEQLLATGKAQLVATQKLQATLESVLRTPSSKDEVAVSFETITLTSQFWNAAAVTGGVALVISIFALAGYGVVRLLSPA